MRGVGYNYFTEMCSGSEAGSYLRLIDLVYHPTLGSRVIKKKKKFRVWGVHITKAIPTFEMSIRCPANLETQASPGQILVLSYC